MHNKWLHPTQALQRQFSVTETTTATTENKVSETVRRLGFKIGDIGLLIGDNTISELTDILPICRIPNTPVHLLGLVNLRGNLTPVFDLHHLLNVTQQQKTKQMLLVLGRGEKAAGLLIDDLPAHQILLRQEKLESLPQLTEVIKPFISGGYKQQNNMWLNFDYQSFFQSLA